MKNLMMGTTVLLALALVGCGGDDKKAKGTPGTVNEDNAKTSATQTISAVTPLLNSANDMDGQTAANSLYQAANTARGNIQPSAMALLMKGVQGGLAAGTCECADKSCTFEDCGETGAFVMNGTISWADGNVVTDITYVYESAGFEINLETDLMVTETSIDGTMGSDGEYDFGSLGGADSGIDLGGFGDLGNYTWTSNTTFNDVTYTGGQATGGSIAFSGTYVIGGTTYSGEGEASFGGGQ